MTRDRISSLASHNSPRNLTSAFDRSPMVSSDEEQFLAGKIEAGEYLKRGQEEAEGWIRVEGGGSYRPPTLRLLHMFAAFAAVLYMSLAAIFFLSESVTAAFASALVSMGFTVGIILYRAVRNGLD